MPVLLVVPAEVIGRLAATTKAQIVSIPMLQNILVGSAMNRCMNRELCGAMIFEVRGASAQPVWHPKLPCDTPSGFSHSQKKKVVLLCSRGQTQGTHGVVSYHLFTWCLVPSLYLVLLARFWYKYGSPHETSSSWYIAGDSRHCAIRHCRGDSSLVVLTPWHILSISWWS